MKKLITIIAVSLLTINAQAQYGGVIRAVNNSNVIGEIQRVGASMKVHDTALVNIQTAMKLKTDSIYTRLGGGVGVSSIPSVTQATLEDISTYTLETKQQLENYLQPLKLKTDSIYKRMYQDSVNLAKLGTGVTITGSVNSTISGVTKKILSTQVVSADTGLVVNAVMHGITTGGGGGYVDVKVNPSGALTVEATLDSTTQRSTMKISNFPASQAVTFTRLKLATDTLTASLDATDSTNLAGINSKLGGTLTVGSHAVTNAGTFAVQATQSGTWNVNNVSGTISLPTGAATESTLSQIATDLHYGKGASSTGVKGPMVLGAVSYSAPTPLDSTLLPLSINSKGAQRVVIMNGTNEITAFADSTTGSRLGVKLLVNPTITNDSSTLSRTTIKVSNFPATQPISGSVTATLDSATQRTTFKVSNFPATQPVSFTRLKSSTDTVAITGSITATSTAGATAIYDSTWTATSMTVTSLNSLASSATVGWQSDSVRNNVRKALDYKINVKLTMANTLPANDKGIYIYICPFYFDGTNWYAASQGTTTLPTGAQGASTIASPNNLRLLGVLSYTTQNQVCQDNFLLSNAFGNVMPDGFSIIIVNFSGAAVSASGNVVNYSPINKVQR
jgi:hypothetical protein